MKMKKKIIIHYDFSEMGKIILSDSAGNTYTSKSEELIDFISGCAIHNEQEQREANKKRNEKYKEALKENFLKSAQIILLTNRLQHEINKQNTLQSNAEIERLKALLKKKDILKKRCK